MLNESMVKRHIGLTLKTWYEAVSKKILPSLRALVAEVLINNYGYTQTQVAEALGVTQPAVSNYLSGKRGGDGARLLRRNRIVMRNVERIAYCITMNDLGCVNDILDNLIEYMRGDYKLLEKLLGPEYKDLISILKKRRK